MQANLVNPILPLAERTLINDQDNKKSASAKFSFDQFPLEIFIKVLSFLNHKELNQVVLVNHHWRQIVIQEEIRNLKLFVHFMIKCVGSSFNIYLENSLKEIGQTLSKKKNYIYLDRNRVKQKIINQIKQFSFFQIEQINSKVLSQDFIQFIIQFYNISKLYRKAYIINKENTTIRDINIIKIMLVDLVKQDYLQLALKIVKLVVSRLPSNSCEKDAMLQEISVELVKQETLEKANEVEEQIKDSKLKSETVCKIFVEILGKQTSDHKSQMIAKILTAHKKEIIEESKPLFLVKEEEIKVINRMKAVLLQTKDKNKVFKMLSHQLMKKDQVDLAIRVAHQITHLGTEQAALQFIVIELSNKNRFEQAGQIIKEEFSKKESSNEWQQESIRVNALNLAKEGHFDQALEWINFLPEKWKKFMALHFVAIELAKQGLIDRAKEIANKIGDREKRNYTHKGIEVAQATSIKKSL